MKSTESNHAIPFSLLTERKTVMKRNIMLLAAALLTLLAARADDPPRATIELLWADGLPMLTFDLTSGTDYGVEERTNLVAGAWESVGGGCAQSGTETHFLTTSAAGSRFYRLLYDEDLADAEDGEEWGTFDFAVLSNQVDALQAAHTNAGYGGLIVITNYPAGEYQALTHEETSATGTVTTLRQIYEGTNAVYQHLTFDTILEFFPPPLMCADGMAPEPDPVRPLSGVRELPGGVGLRFPGSQAFQSGNRSEVTIQVRGNVVTAGDFQYDFSTSELLWEPPSIGERIRQLWQQGPPMFNPYPPSGCGDAIAICNARSFSVLEQRTAVYSWGMLTETYQFLFDYCYRYTCPSGPLEKILVVFFKYSYVMRDKSGSILFREAQNAYYAGDETP
jgi:hypothetical protein